MITKKPTYQELEEERDFYFRGLIFLMIVFAIGFCIICFIFNTSISNIKSENQQLKSKLNDSNFKCEWKQIAVTGGNFNLYFDSRLVFNSSKYDIKPSISFMVKQCEVIE